MSNIKIYSDGGSRGNPGPAGIGVVIQKKNVSAQGGSASGRKRKDIEIKKYIGVKTNNQAEYTAVVEALEWLKENNHQNSDIEFFLDSQLVVEQLNGNYKIKNEGLKPLFNRARELVLELGGRVTFSHITRDKNAKADRLVNMAIDKETKKVMSN